MKKGWSLKKLGEVCDKTSNINWRQNGNKDYKYIDLSAVSRETLSITEYQRISSGNAPSRAKKIVLNNDVIFATTRPTLKRATIIDNDFEGQICSTGFSVLRPKKDEIISKYIFYNLLTEAFMAYVEKLQKGASYPAITDSEVKKYRILLPPLPEQKRIVKILDEAFAAIDKAKANAEQNLKNAKELFESYLQSVFENKGGGWEEKKIMDIGVAQTGTTPKTSDKENYGDFIPFIKPADIDITGNGEIRYDNEGLSEQGLQNGRKMLEGSILMVCIGASIGKVGYTNRDVSCNQQINSLTVRQEFHPKFFYYALSTRGFFEQVMQNAAQATLPIINKGKWETLTVSFPKSKSKQQTIVQKLDALSAETKKLETIYQQKLNDLEELKKSILQKAFNGELANDN